MKYFVWIIIGVVAVVIVGGLIVAGSPMHARMMRFDERRTSDLSDMQWRITSAWQTNGSLPTTLSDLNDSISGYRVPVDPETGVMYEYAVTAPLSFKLCATFKLPLDTTSSMMQQGYYSAPVPSPYQDNWAHDAGHFCFDRTIDPNIYKPSDDGTGGGPTKLPM
jgi:hypothetical protein